MADTLFPDLEPPAPVPVEKLSADRRRTRRQKEAIARGVHPVTRLPLHSDPAAKCGTCALRSAFGHGARSYQKCTLDAPDGNIYAGPFVSSSAATDIRAWWPGCTRWQPIEAHA